MKALIIATKDVGGDNELSDPSRLRIYIEPKDCTLDEFLDALDVAEYKEDFGECCPPFLVYDGEPFIEDLGIFLEDPDVGSYICVENNIISIEIPEP